jgi:hypothetical protein
MKKTNNQPNNQAWKKKKLTFNESSCRNIRINQERQFLSSQRIAIEQRHAIAIVERYSIE